MEKNFHETLELMELRPVKYKGTEIDYVPVVFDDCRMYKLDIEDADPLGMTPGDSVRISCRVYSDENKHNYIFTSLYLSDDVLSDFISKFDGLKIKGCAKMKLQLVYEIVDDICYETKKELFGFKVLKIYDK